MIRQACRLGELCLSDVRTGTEVLARMEQTADFRPVKVMSGACDPCRFVSRVDFTDTCWLWTGSRYRQFGQPTYGQVMYRGRRTGAHRVAYLLWRGEITDGLDVLHTCDVKPCVNPDHLRLGTHAENIQEAFDQRPGHFAGERNGRARLTWPDVRAIRDAAGEGESYAALAARWSISPVHARAIVFGLRWPE